jgi:hypothetical protein
MVVRRKRPGVITLFFNIIYTIKYPVRILACALNAKTSQWQQIIYCAMEKFDEKWFRVLVRGHRGDLQNKGLTLKMLRLSCMIAKGHGRWRSLHKNDGRREFNSIIPCILYFIHRNTLSVWFTLTAFFLRPQAHLIDLQALQSRFGGDDLMFSLACAATQRYSQWYTTYIHSLPDLQHPPHLAQPIPTQRLCPPLQAIHLPRRLVQIPLLKQRLRPR